MSTHRTVPGDVVSGSEGATKNSPADAVSGSEHQHQHQQQLLLLDDDAPRPSARNIYEDEDYSLYSDDDDSRDPAAKPLLPGFQRGSKEMLNVSGGGNHHSGDSGIYL